MEQQAAQLAARFGKALGVTAADVLWALGQVQARKVVVDNEVGQAHVTKQHNNTASPSAVVAATSSVMLGIAGSKLLLLCLCSQYCSCEGLMCRTVTAGSEMNDRLESVLVCVVRLPPRSEGKWGRATRACADRGVSNQYTACTSQHGCTLTTVSKRAVCKV